jgi:hypothetical protein
MMCVKTRLLRCVGGTYRVAMYNSNHSAHTYDKNIRDDYCNNKTKVKTSLCKSAPPFCPDYDCVNLYGLPFLVVSA